MTWNVPRVDPVEPATILPEREALEGWLDFHRDMLLFKSDGLTAEQLKLRAVPPSSLSLLGLIRHMTDVERWWFRIHAADQDLPALYETTADPDADFNDIEGADAQANVDAFRREVELARSETRGKALDDVVRSHGHHPERTRDIRWIYLHMIEEYARHNGHADLLRERIDGVTGY